MDSNEHFKTSTPVDKSEDSQITIFLFISCSTKSDYICLLLLVFFYIYLFFTFYFVSRLVLGVHFTVPAHDQLGDPDDWRPPMQPTSTSEMQRRTVPDSTLAGHHGCPPPAELFKAVVMNYVRMEKNVSDFFLKLCCCKHIAYHEIGKKKER